MKKSIIALTTLLSIVYSTQNFAQKSLEAGILGTWELLEKKDSGPLSELDFDMEPPKASSKESGSDNKTTKKFETILYFQSNNLVDFILLGTQGKMDYHVKDSILTMGSKDYKIIKLDDNNLVLFLEQTLKNTTYYYEKSEKVVNPIKKEEIVEEKYEDGKLKLKGLKEFGMAHGVWTEWYNSGKIKSVKYFNHDYPLMKIEFNEEGEIILKEWYDIQNEQIRND